jgi:hypothetical protein
MIVQYVASTFKNTGNHGEDIRLNVHPKCVETPNKLWQPRMQRTVSFIDPSQQNEIYYNIFNSKKAILE